MNEEIVVLDFETTGMQADFCRVIEVGAVLVREDEIVDTFSELMNPGQRIPGFIQQLTGISNAMIAGKPSPEEVMVSLAEFVGDRPILAHNASFDKRFYIAEMNRANIDVSNQFMCSLMLARRLVPDSPNHKLGTLVDYFDVRTADFNAHRALDDATATARVWMKLRETLAKMIGRNDISLEPFFKLQKRSKKQVPAFIASLR